MYIYTNYTKLNWRESVYKYININMGNTGSTTCGASFSVEQTCGSTTNTLASDSVETENELVMGEMTTTEFVTTTDYDV